ncbi:MAG: hypothetical protein AAF490_18050 [Chloroflexota bacterium]
MKSITIHKIDDETEQALLKIAERDGISLNKLVKQLLRESLGLEVPVPNHRAEFEEFLGSWSIEEKTEFDQKVAIFDTISDDDWT